MPYNEIMNNGNYVDFNQPDNYVLQWIQESEFARDAYRSLLFRSALAKEGLPSRNIYQEKMTSNLNRIGDAEKRKKFADMCAHLPIGRSFALADAVDNRANQLAGGVDSYECEVNDPYMVIDDKTEDLLAAQCQQDYTRSGLKYMASQFSDDLSWAGMAAVLVKYDEDSHQNTILRVNPKNVWFDTKYSSLGKERFRGFSTMISWAALVDIIKHDQDEVNLGLSVPDRSIIDRSNRDKVKVINDGYGYKKIETINDLDIYVRDLNELATSPQLQGTFDRRFDEYTHDLNQCYNLGWYRTYATDSEAKTKSGYNGDDVELTVMYDLCRKIEYKIINRRFIISKNRAAFRRTIPYEIFNPFTQTVKLQAEEFTLNCPLIVKFERRNMDLKPYPQAPVFSLLDEHDELCALIAKRKHVTDIVSLLRIVANSADADSLGDAMNIMGIILDDVQGDISTVTLTYDYTPIDSEIARIENEIKRHLKGYDDFDAMQSMGDRATAAESGQAVGAIANGLTTLQQTVMSLYAGIAQQCIGNHVTYSPEGTFQIWNGGDYSILTIQQMAALAVVDAKPKLAKKVQEKMLATNALAIATSLGGTGLINKEGVAYLLEQALYGQVPRGMAAQFVNKPTVSAETVQANAEQAKNMATMLQQNEDMYMQNPIPYEVNDAVQSMSPSELDQVIAGLSGGASSAPAPAPAPAEGGIDITGSEDNVTGISLGDIGIGSEAAGEIANSMMA